MFAQDRIKTVLIDKHIEDKRNDFYGKIKSITFSRNYITEVMCVIVELYHQEPLFSMQTRKEIINYPLFVVEELVKTGHFTITTEEGVKDIIKIKDWKNWSDDFATLHELLIGQYIIENTKLWLKARKIVSIEQILTTGESKEAHYKMSLRQYDHIIMTETNIIELLRDGYTFVNQSISLSQPLILWQTCKLDWLHRKVLDICDAFRGLFNWFNGLD